MKMKKIYLIGMVLALLVSACELPDNIDPKGAPEVTADVILTAALGDGLAIIDDMNQNRNVSRFLCQYSSQMQYTDPSRYQFSDRQIPDGYWNASYLVLQDLNRCRSLVEASVSGVEEVIKANENKLAVLDIMDVLMYQNLVDFFGNVPYSEALGGYENKTPAYDDAAAIYANCQTRLTDAINTLKANDAYGNWGAEDIVYGGDNALWAKTAATLKLRMGMRLADSDATTAQAMLAEAVAAGCLEAGEYMQLPWTGVAPYVNTIYDVFIIANRNDYAPSETIIALMDSISDARMVNYFTLEDGAYVGLPYGEVANNAYNSFSHFWDVMFEPDFPATITGNDEVEFLLAEAAARGWTTPMTAQEHYEAGIAESHSHWGVTMDPTYLTHVDVAWDAARAKELIGIQKWIALYNRGNEGYAVWRCFDWPVLSPPEDMTYADIPFRMPYPYNEPDLNLDNYTAAAAAIGGDEVRTRLFWDAIEGTETPSAGF